MMKTDNINDERRSFIMKILWGASALAASIVGIPVIGALVAPLIRKPPNVWRKVAGTNELEVGECKLVTFENASPLPWAGLTSRTAAWLRRNDTEEFIAFSINCVHLGCPVRWEPDAEIFLCPCHGGVYNKDGSRAAGPPLKALQQYPVRIENDEVQIQTSPVPITTLESHEKDA